MNTQTIFTGWHLMRWLRLLAGVFIGFSALQSHDSVAYLISAFFLVQAITNTGCGACAVQPTAKKPFPETGDVTYEEIKEK